MLNKYSNIICIILAIILIGILIKASTSEGKIWEEYAGCVWGTCSCSNSSGKGCKNRYGACGC